MRLSETHENAKLFLKSYHQPNTFDHLSQEAKDYRLVTFYNGLRLSLCPLTAHSLVSINRHPRVPCEFRTLLRKN